MTVVAFLAIAVAVSCRSSRPAGAPFAPLTSTTSEAASAELAQRRSDFRGARALLRVRATNGGETQSFRAALIVPDAQHVEMTAYTPVGTVAASLKADGDRVTFREAGKEPRELSARQLAGSFGVFGSTLTPAQLAMLIIGLPPEGTTIASTSPAGLEHVTIDDLDVVFDPPVYPPKHVTVTRGSDRAEIELLELGVE
jgi:hypothetical protein